MKVLYIVHDSNLFGGANIALLEMIDCLIKNYKINPIILVPDERGELIVELKKRNIKYIVFPYKCCVYHKCENFVLNILRYLNLIIKQLLMMLSVNKLRKIVLKENIELIHTNTSVVNIGYILSACTGLKHLGHIREFGEEHLNMRFILGRKISRIFMYKNSDKLVFISNSILEKYKKILKNNNGLELVYDGVSSKHKNLNIKNLDDEIFRIIIVGNIQSGKNQLHIVEVVKELIEQGFKINLYIIGNVGERNYYNKVVESIETSNYIKLYTGIRDIDKLKEVRTKCDCEIVCSYMEGFGRVSVEGMLSSLPIIASNSGANPEIIKNGENGFIYSYGDLNDLKKKIIYLYNNREEVSRMGKTGYEMAINYYMEEINAKNIYDVYLKILKEGENL